MITRRPCTPPRAARILVRLVKVKQPRKPPSQAEQARRRAWGFKWGAMVRDATANLRGGNG